LNEVFADTSGFLALLMESDRQHARAQRTFRTLGERESPLATTSYVLAETYALLDRRVGRNGVFRFREELEDLLHVTWVGKEEHDAGLAMLRARPRSVSLTDAVSFVVARRLGIREVFAFDPHFRREGFTVL